MTDKEKAERLSMFCCIPLEQAVQFVACFEEMQSIQADDAEEQRVAHASRLSREGEVRRWGPTGKPPKR